MQDFKRLQYCGRYVTNLKYEYKFISSPLDCQCLLHTEQLLEGLAEVKTQNLTFEKFNVAAFIAFPVGAL